MGYRITNPVTGQETPEKAKLIVKRQIEEFTQFLTEVTACTHDIQDLRALSDAIDAATDCIDLLQDAKLIFSCECCGRRPIAEQCGYDRDYCDECFKEIEDDREYYESLRYYR